ncbi:MAG: hypothetical protein JWM16_6349 [Verrucomicrobiales bacterium]|nr:hypothetical protein [Verrucomicrobiales bacterium]
MPSRQRRANGGRQGTNSLGSRVSSRGSGPAGEGGGGLNLPAPDFRTQWVTDPGFASGGSHTLSGSGLGTSSVTGGVLQITSTDNVYFERPTFSTEPLVAGTYTVTFTILNYSTGSISLVSSPNTNLTTSAILGTIRAANGTFTENIVLASGGYIGLSGRGSAVVNSMQIDNLTVQRAA